MYTIAFAKEPPKCEQEEYTQAKWDKDLLLKEEFKVEKVQRERDKKHTAIKLAINNSCMVVQKILKQLRIQGKEKGP